MAVLLQVQRKERIEVVVDGRKGGLGEVDVFFGEESAGVVRRELGEQVVDDLAFDEEFEVEKGGEFIAVLVGVLLSLQVFVGVGFNFSFGFREREFFGEFFQSEDVFEPVGSDHC